MFLELNLGDPDGLLELTTRASQFFAVNAERGAIQVVDCGGRVVAHLPVAPEVFSAMMQNPR